MPRVVLILFLLISSALFAGCSDQASLRTVDRLGDEVLERELEYTGPLHTVGFLAQAYANNTYALRRTNNKLHTICIAMKRCPQEQEATE